MTKPVRKIDEQKIRGLIDVSRGKQAATAWIKGGTILNVYTGELEQADIVIYEDRIAYVGNKEPMTNDLTKIIDATGHTLVPGYIEPHAHPFQLYNPKTLGEFALSLGTTTLVNDNLIFYLNMDEEGLKYLMDYSTELPVKNYWWVRLDPQSPQPEMLAKFTSERLVSLLEHEQTLQAGELTSWPALLAGDELMISGITEARKLGKRIEGHNPGASSDTLNVMAALGVTACHEAINGEEVLRRLRLGMYATLRHSSIRPDLPDLVQGLKEMGVRFDTPRLMMTTDGSMPPFHQYGFVDYMIKLAIEHGVEPVNAYRMATINPAVYYGLDQEIGGIAPGRVADILFLEDLYHPTPLKVMADGKMMADKGSLLIHFPECDWKRIGLVPMDKAWRLKKEWLDEPVEDVEVPVIELLNAVITKPKMEKWLGQEDLCYVSLIDQNGKWVTNGFLRGFADRLDAVATTYTASQDILVIGKSKEAMVKAVNELLELGGGMILKEGDETLFELGLPLGGKMSTLSMEQLIEQTSEFVRLLKQRGHRHIDPLYTMFFLSATHLPAVRLTADGIYSIKENKTLSSAKKL